MCRKAPPRAPVTHSAWLTVLQDTLIRAATARSSHGFSRASSDAGSVIDSVSSTPRGCGPARSQQHTLQAVASRLQHVQSCELPYVQHKAMRNSRAAAASGCWDSENCSDAASWADEHVSCRRKTTGVLANPFTLCKTFLHYIPCMQLDWKQQHAADLSRRQLESKQALGQLSSSVQKLEEKLHEVMAWQVRSSSLQPSACKLHGQSQKHSCSSSIAEDSLSAAQRQSASRASRVFLENGDGLDAEQVILANKAKHTAHWVQQSTTAKQQEGDEPGVSASVHAMQGSCQESNIAAVSERQQQLVSCHLSHPDSNVSVNLCVNACHDSDEQVQQQAAQTRYSRWLATVGIVEDASQQLKVRNHNPGPGARSVSYARLLIDCASTEMQSEILAA